jgi:hypothetical protein
MAKLLDCWHGPTVSKPILLETMLLHDLGNLVKFNLRSESPQVKALLDATELPFYQALQTDWHKKYGTDVDAATCQLITELPLQHTTAITHLISHHNPEALAGVVASQDWAQKLCDYTDFRVGPQGLVTLPERFADLAARYQDNHPQWQDPTEIQRRLHLFQTLETQLQTHLSCDLSTLTAADLGPLDRWWNYRFATSGILTRLVT